MPIPRILHFTWKDARLPPNFARNLVRWRALHPGWDIRFYSDADIRAFVAKVAPPTPLFFDAYPVQIQRTDVFRYFALFDHGGVYADLDIYPRQPIDELVAQSECFLALEPEVHALTGTMVRRALPFVFCNAFMGSVAGHPFLEKVKELLPSSTQGPVLETTGPVMLMSAAMTGERSVRPDLVAPDCWSPHTKYGTRPGTRSEYLSLVREQFTVLGEDRPEMLDHRWAYSWGASGSGIWDRRLRTLVHRLSVGLGWRVEWRAGPSRGRYKVPRKDYHLQGFTTPDPLPRITLVVEGGTEADARRLIAALDYPDGLIDIAASPSARGSETELAAWRNRAGAKAASRSRYLVLAAPGLTHMPADALRLLVSTGREVSVANAVDAQGKADEERTFVHSYTPRVRWWPTLRRPARDGPRLNLLTMSLDDRMSLQIAPLDAFGPGLVVIDNAVFRAGVRFPERPYKGRMGSEGFTMMARDRGFEVCGLPRLKVVLRR
ncbi:MAG: glycosyltransferase [Cucumibacter sp.]